MSLSNLFPRFAICLTGIFCLLVMTACHPEQMAVNDLTSFTERLESSSANYSEADWDDAIQHYCEILATIARYEYNDSLQTVIEGNKQRCETIFRDAAVTGNSETLMEQILQLDPTFLIH